MEIKGEMKELQITIEDFKDKPKKSQITIDKHTTLKIKLNKQKQEE